MAEPTRDPMFADEVLTTTRAVRRRLDFDRPVPRELVEECLEVALQAPSGSNMQAWHFVVVESPDRKAAIAELYRRSFEVYRTWAPGSPDREKPSSPDAHRVFGSAEYLAENLQRAPYLLLSVLRGRCEEMATAQQQSRFWADIHPATWSFMLAGRSRGLGTAWTGMHLRYEAEVAELLEIPVDRYTQASLTPIAYTIGSSFSPATRRPLADVVHWDRW